MGNWLSDFTGKLSTGILGDRADNEYSGVNQGNFNLPGYQQHQDRVSGYLGQVDSRQAPNIAPTERAQQSGFAGQQRGLADMLMDRARGNNSVAEMQLKQGLEQGNRQQMSMMAGARPQNAGLAMLMGSQNMANNAMGMSGQAALARAQESQMAAQSLGGVLAQGRGADENLNMFNAGANNQRSLAGAQMQQNQMGLNDAARQGLLGSGLQASGLQQQGGMNYEQNRTNRYLGHLGMPTAQESVVGGVTGIIGALAPGGK